MYELSRKINFNMIFNNRKKYQENISFEIVLTSIGRIRCLSLPNRDCSPIDSSLRNSKGKYTRSKEAIRRSFDKSVHASSETKLQRMEMEERENLPRRYYPRYRVKPHPSPVTKIQNVDAPRRNSL